MPQNKDNDEQEFLFSELDDSDYEDDYDDGSVDVVFPGEENDWGFDESELDDGDDEGSDFIVIDDDDENLPVINEPPTVVDNTPDSPPDSPRETPEAVESVDTPEHSVRALEAPTELKSPAPEKGADKPSSSKKIPRPTWAKKENLAALRARATEYATTSKEKTRGVLVAVIDKLSGIPVVGKACAPFHDFPFLFPFFPLVFIAIITTAVVFFSAPKATTTIELPDSGEVTLSSGDFNEDTKTITMEAENTGGVITSFDINVGLYSYVFSLSPSTWLSFQQVGTCSMEDVEVDDTETLEIPCTLTQEPGASVRASELK